MKNETHAGKYFWLCAGITLANALTSMGFSIAALSSSGDAHTNALYAVSRSVALVAMCIVVVLLRNRTGLMVLSATMVLVQLGDAFIGVSINDAMKTFGPAFLALITLCASVLLFKEKTINNESV